MNTNIYSLPDHASRAVEVLRCPELLKSTVKEVLPRPLMCLAGLGREAYWRIVHPYTFGAAVALTGIELTDEAEVVLVRNACFDSDTWSLPGGGIDSADKKVVKDKLLNGVYPEYLPKEYFLPGAIRELREEIGIVVASESAVHVGNYPNFSGLGATVPTNRDTLAVFHVAHENFDELEFRIQKSELEEARRWKLGNILDRTVGSSVPDPSMAWYLGSVVTKLLSESQQEQSLPLSA